MNPIYSVFQQLFGTKKTAASAPLALGTPPVADDSAVRAIAFYLPQFHPIPENDAWWGKGFTEWTNVSKAQPLFDGHYQPRQPADLGYYDLRIADVRRAQAEMARKYGIHGFCYYHYWFGGKRLLERPFEEVLASKEPDFPFCLCWANENWTRRWDGSENEILMEQRYSEDDYRQFAEDLIPAFKDSRYIRIDGKPLFLVYRPSIIPNVNKAIRIWRDVWRKEIGEVHLCASLSFGDLDPIRYGFDSASEFPPHGNWTTNQLHGDMPQEEMTGGIYEYSEAVLTYMLRKLPSYTFFRTVFPAWDNSPRKGKAAHVFHNSTPEAYEFWLKSVIEQTKQRYKGEERIVFINAWNEWAEGAYLEPDRKFGHAYLAATKRAISGISNADTVIELFRELLARKHDELAFYADELKKLIDSRDNTIRILTSFAKHNILSNEYFSIKPVMAGNPAFLSTHTANAQMHSHMDNLHTGNGEGETHIDRRTSLYIKGWAFCPAISERALYVLFKNMDSGEMHYSPFYTHVRRDDLVESYGASYPEKILQDCGFEDRIDTRMLEPGKYQIGIAIKGGDVYALSWWPHPLFIA